MSELVLPQNLDAERSVLGAVMVDNARLVDALEVVRPDDFFRVAHRTIFAAMIRMGEVQQAIDLVTLREILSKTGHIDDVGGASYLAALGDGMPRGANVKHYAGIVRDKADLRRLIDGSNRMLRRAYEAEDDAATILAEAERTIIGLADRRTSRGFESMRDIASRGLDAIERAHLRREAVSGVPSGFDALDALTRGFQPGTLVTVGARPGMGKTSIGQNIAQNAALAGYVVGCCSLEMENDELFMRHVASLARVDSHRLQSGYLGEREWGHIASAVGQLAEAPLFIDETPAINLFDVRSRARRLKVEHGLQLLVVDYLQLMSTPEGADRRAIETRALALGSITGGLKALAKELKIPILLLSQLSRELEKRGNRPRLSDLRDSGSIEQDSDIVMFLWRPETPQPPDDETTTELIIAKHRGGPIGTVKLTWYDQQTRFTTYELPDRLPVDQQLPVGDR